ncbi:MAG: hypothetical protein O7B81_03445, partial [Gammaproteobacteria bacterium]|nr:hypothetical protein [Gammaproteobacteria bacterium]
SAAIIAVQHRSPCSISQAPSDHYFLEGNRCGGGRCQVTASNLSGSEEELAKRDIFSSTKSAAFVTLVCFPSGRAFKGAGPRMHSSRPLGVTIIANGCNSGLSGVK